MKILFITPQIPWPPHSGGRIVTWNTIRRFAETDEVHVVSLYHHPDEQAYLSTMREVCASAEAFPARGKWSIPTLLRSLLSTWPYKAHRFFNAEMANYVQRLVHEQQIDIIHAQNFYTTTYVRGDENVLRIHYKENIEGNVLLRFARTQSNPLVSLAAWLEGHRTRRFEQKACAKFDRVLTISPLDCEALAQLGIASPVQHQRPGVDIKQYPMMDEPDLPPTLVFTGTMSYYPNTDGIEFFLRECWPVIRAAVPSAQLKIVGASPPQRIEERNGVDGIEVTGRVPDVEPYLRNSHVYLVPLRVGGGIRLKILEAMASGRAIVSTPIGCEGLDGRDGEHLRIAEMPDAFTTAVIELLQDAEARNCIRTNARALVEDAYDWDRVIATQRQAYSDWLALRQRPPADR